MLESVARQLARSRKNRFYSRLDESLEAFGFSEKVRALCAPAYGQSAVGRPGTDPVVYVKMLMAGFFENLASERAMAEACADSIALRAFLHYGVEERTPEHSWLTIMRQRLGPEVYHQVFILILSELQRHGLVQGQQVGVDTSVVEANASLRGLVHRHTEEAYWDYVKRLAQEQGIDPEDSQAVRRFDRKRSKTMSNEDWVNPHEPDAKIGPKKDGAIDMIYKPEVVVDLESGAVVQAEVLPGDQADHQEVSTRLQEAQQTINAARAAESRRTIRAATADMGYHAPSQLLALQRELMQTVIPDPVRNRRMDRLEEAERHAVQLARRHTRSPKGRSLLRRRGMHLERSFALILDWGGMRRTTLRGLENIRKRFKLAAAFYNLSQLMRHLFGLGTPKQWAAAPAAVVLT